MSAGGIVVIGEALVDIVHRADGTVDEAPGGSPANVALTLGRLDRHPLLVTRIGDDPHGTEVRRWLADSDVTVVATSAERTSTAAATLDASGSASYDFDLVWELDEIELDQPDALHIGSIAAVLAPGADVVARLVEQHAPSALITFDPNIRTRLITDPADARARIDALIAQADVVKVSDEDLEWLAPGEPPQAVAERWLDAGAGLVVVTLGGDGALGFRAQGAVAVPGVPVSVVDTVGAGDTFMGTLIDQLLPDGADGSRAKARLRMLEDAALEQVLRACATAAAVTVSRPGADPPRRGESGAGRSDDGAGASVTRTEG